MHKTRPLDLIEIRVLGALMEKEQTTPDHYPLTINGVIAACNQKSNRDPVTSLTETQVVEALDRLSQDVLTWRTEGARVERWQHSLDRRWQLTPATKAIMTELMVRGPQSPGELRTRCERMHRFESKEAVEAVLRKLADGFDPLVRELPRQVGQRFQRWQHVVATEDADAEPLAEATVAPAPSPAPRPAAAPEPSPAVPDGPTPVERLESLEAAVTELRNELQELRTEHLELRRRLGDLD